ncbi:MAG: winged helix-turn-helix transcriptional regulator [bacterium]
MSRVLLVPVALLALLLSPLAAADPVDELGNAIDDAGATSRVEQPIDPKNPVEDLERRLGQGTGGDNNVPVPPGGDEGIVDLAPRVGEIIAENWALTSIITVGLVGSVLAGWLLVSRYVDPRIALRNPQRSMLYGFVKGNPGVHLKQLSSEFRMKTSTVLWHVRKLEAADLVRSKKSNGYRVFYPVSGGAEARQLSEAVTALSNDNARRIFESITANPGCQQRHLALNLGINPGTIRWHLKKLKEAALLQEEGQHRLAAYFPTDLGRRAHQQVLGQPQPLSSPVVAATPGASAQSVAPEEILS